MSRVGSICEGCIFGIFDVLQSLVDDYNVQTNHKMSLGRMHFVLNQVSTCEYDPSDEICLNNSAQWDKTRL